MKQIYKKPEMQIVSVKTEMPFALSFSNEYNSSDVTYVRENDIDNLLLFE